MSDTPNIPHQPNDPLEPEYDEFEPADDESHSHFLDDHHSVDESDQLPYYLPIASTSYFDEGATDPAPSSQDEAQEFPSLIMPDPDPAQQLYRISPAEPSNWEEYTLPPLEDELPPEEDETSSWRTAWSVIREVGETIILTLVIFFLIQTVVRNFRVVGTSMVGNLHDGQYLIIDKVTYNSYLNDFGLGGPQRGDVIVFEPPNRPDDDYVKRIIGLPGETVEIRGGAIFINGEPLDEPFDPNTGSYSLSPRVIPEGEVFVLGDNRNNSNDSHTWGPLPIENIVWASLVILLAAFTLGAYPLATRQPKKQRSKT